ncbi:MAG TPA: hypothetical protein VN256_17160 [Pyrinomonadaceae bacterium]|nr:hypothetical protein [Pyrinomonadaceae bacterium]
MKRRLLIIFLLVAALANVTPAAAGSAAGDTADEQLTAEEERETNELARRFIRRMGETNDVAPVADELFAADFLDRHLGAADDEPLIFISRSLARRLARDEVRRYYVAGINFWYLNALYVYGRFPIADLPETGRLYSPALARLVARLDGVFKKLEQDDEGRPDAEARTAALLRESLGALEKANALLRAEVEGRKLARSALYQKAVADWDEQFRHFKPWAGECDEGCYGLPAGARLIIVNVPSFQLKFARVAGDMKIVSAMPYVD